MTKKICCGARCFKKHFGKNYGGYLVGTGILFTIIKVVLLTASLFEIEHGQNFHASALNTQGFITTNFLETATDAEILAAVFPSVAEIKNNVYTSLWEPKNYDCDPTKMSISRIKAGEILPPAFKGNTLYIISEGIYTTNSQINFEGNCIGVFWTKNVQINSSSPDLTFNLANTNNTVIQNITIDGMKMWNNLFLLKNAWNITLHKAIAKNASIYWILIDSTNSAFLSYWEAFNNAIWTIIGSSTKITINNSKFYYNNWNGIEVNWGTYLSINNNAIFNNMGYGMITKSSINTLINNTFSFGNGIWWYNFSNDAKLTLNNVSASNQNIAITNNADTTYYGNFITSNIKTLNDGKTPLIGWKGDKIFSDAVDLSTPKMDIDFLINPFNGTNYLNDPLNTIDTRIGYNPGFNTTTKTLYEFGKNVQLQQPIYIYDEKSTSYILQGTEGIEFDSTKTISYANPYIPLLWNKYLDNSFWTTENLLDADIKFALFGDKNTASAYTYAWADQHRCDIAKMQIMNIPDQKTFDEFIKKWFSSDTIFLMAPGKYSITSIAQNSISCFALVGKWGDVYVKGWAKEIFNLGGAHSFIFDNIRLEWSLKTSYGIALANDNYFTFHNIFLKEFSSVGLRIDNSNSYMITHSESMNNNGAGIVTRWWKNAIFDNIFAYNNKVWMDIMWDYMTINNSVSSFNDIGMTFQSSNNIIVNNSIASNNLIQWMVFDGKSTQIHLNNVGLWNNKIAYSNTSSDPEINYFGTLNLVGNGQISDQNTLNIGSWSPLFTDWTISNQDISKQYLINPRNDDKMTFMVDKNAAPETWIGKKSLVFDNMLSNEYGFAVPLQKELVRYIDVTATKDSTENIQYNSTKYITEKNPILNVKLTREGNELVDTLQQTINYQVNAYPGIYTINGDIEEDGATWEVTSATGKIQITLNNSDIFGTKKIAITIVKGKEKTEDRTSFIYDPTLATIYKDIKAKFVDTSCTFENVVILDPWTNVIPEFLKTNTFYYLKAGNFMTDFQINMTKCTAFIGETADKVNIYMTKIWASDAIISAINKEITLSDIIVKNINIDWWSDGKENFNRCEKIGINNITECNKAMICAEDMTLTEADCAKAWYTRRNAQWISTPFGIRFYNLDTNIFLEDTKVTNFVRDISIDTARNISVKNIETTYADSNWIEITNSNNNNFETISSANNNENGVYLDVSSDNTFSYVYAYKNTNGIRSNASKSNFIDWSDIYNNTLDGIQLSNVSDENKINNTKVFNNWWTAIIISDSLFNTINNTQTYNNGEGIAIQNSNNTFVNNSQSYNNSHVNPISDKASKCGVRIVGSTVMLKDTDLYNNDTDGIFIGELSTVYYYGNLNVFGNKTNIEDMTNGLKKWIWAIDAAACPEILTIDNFIPDCWVRTLGFKDGILNETNDTMSCNNVTQVSNAKWDKLFTKTDCADIWQNNTWIWDVSPTYTYGSEIMKQEIPFWFTMPDRTNIYLEKVNLKRQPCKYIGDFGPFASDVCFADLYINKIANQKTITAGEKWTFTITIGNTKDAKAEDQAPILEDILSPGIEFYTSAIAPISIEPNYYGTYFIPEDPCFKELTESFKWPEADLFQIYLTIKATKRGIKVPTVLEWATTYAGYEWVEADLGKFITNFCAKGGTFKDLDGISRTRAWGDFVSCLEYVFKNDTIHNIITRELPNCGAYSDRFLTEKDTCLNKLITESAGVYMDEIDKIVETKTANNVHPSKSLYEVVTRDNTSESYKAFDTYTQGWLEQTKLIPFLMDFTRKKYGVPFWFMLVDNKADFTLGLDPRKFGEECSDQAGWTKLTWNLNTLKPGDEQTIEYTVIWAKNVDRLSVLNRAEIIPSFWDLNLTNNISQRWGPVVTPNTIDLSTIDNATDEEIETYFEDKGIDPTANAELFKPEEIQTNSPKGIAPMNIDIKEWDTTLRADLVLQSDDPKKGTTDFSELYIPADTTLTTPTLDAWCEAVLKAPTFLPKDTAKIENNNIITVIHAGLNCPQSLIFNKEIELRLTVPNLPQTVKVWSSSDGKTWTPRWTDFKTTNNRIDLKTSHLTYFAFGTPIPPVILPTTPATTNNHSSAILKQDNCPNGDFSKSYYDKDCWTPSIHNAANASSAICGQSEYIDAFNFAADIGITSASTCEKANLGTYITRAEFAKMISVFATQVMGKKPVTNEACKDFTDIWSYGNLASYIQMACELKLMGMESDGTTVSKKFNPWQYVLRSHLATVISRVVFGNKYNVPLSDADKWSNFWYASHINALKQYNIITQITNANTTKELRGRVVLIMKRAVDTLLTHSIK